MFPVRAHRSKNGLKIGLKWVKKREIDIFAFRICKVFVASYGCLYYTTSQMIM